MFGIDPTNWLLVFVRISAMLAIFPLFSMQNFPVAMRLALAALISFLVAPLLPPLATLPAGFIGMIGWIAIEAGFGLMLGFVSRLFFYVLEFAGSLIAMEMGLNMAATFNPFSNTRSEAPGLILFNLGALVFLTLNLHHHLLVALQKSFVVLPLGAGRLSPALFTDIAGRTGQIFLVGLLMAAPVIAVSFLINVVFSVVGRAVPQMNIFVESLAFRILAGLMVFGLTLNLMAQHIVNYLRRLPEDVLRVAQLLGAAGGSH
ncbi:MAG: flagellar biosynthesis protein FliR [Verrucomicrobiota bacterium]|jgi:flagellar biosynthetic protein FliR